MRKAIQPLLIALVAGTFAGCTTTLPNEPALSLVDLRIGKLTLLESDATVTLRIDNENPVPIPVQGAGVELDLDGSSVGRGVTNQAFEIPAFSSTTQAVPIHLDNLSAVRKIAAAVQNKRVAYRVKANLYTAPESKLGKLRLSHEGDLDAKTFTDAATAVKP